MADYSKCNSFSSCGSDDARSWRHATTSRLDQLALALQRIEDQLNCLPAMSSALKRFGPEGDAAGAEHGAYRKSLRGAFEEAAEEAAGVRFFETTGSRSNSSLLGPERGGQPPVIPGLFRKSVFSCQGSHGGSPTSCVQGAPSFMELSMPVADFDSPAHQGGAPVASAPDSIMPDNWPGDLELREVPGQGRWNSTDSIGLEILESLSKLGDIGGSGLTHSTLIPDDLLKSSSSFFLLKPNSSTRGFLDILSLFALVYDLLAVPVIAAWHLPIQGPLMATALSTLIFWSLDIVVNFRTCFYREGVLIDNPKVIFTRYLKTWFILDFSIVAADWVSMGFVLASVVKDGSDDNPRAGGLRLFRFAKVGRLLRLTGILRAARVVELFERFSERHLSTSFDIFTSIAKLLLGIIWVNHMMSCAWFAIGQGEWSDTGMHWIDLHLSERSRDSYGEAGFWYQYTTGFHWSVTQMTPGSMQVNAVNSLERVFTIICLLLGMVFFSSLVSSVSGKVMQYRMSQENKGKVIATLRRFLHEKRLHCEVAMDVQRQVLERMNAKQPLMMKDVEGVNWLTQSLRNELCFELCSRFLERHPLFRWWADTSKPTALALCREAIDSKAVVRGDTVFDVAATAEAVYIIESGSSIYTPDRGTDMAQVSPAEGTWLAEAALCVVWLHAGSLEAESHLELAMIDPCKIMRILDRSRVVRHVYGEYVRVFAERVRSAKPPWSEWPSDLKVPSAAFRDILPAMAPTARQLVGMMAVRALKSHTFRRFLVPRNSIAELAEEVRRGVSSLMVNGSGEVDRIVVLVALQLERADEKEFVQLATWDGEHTVSAVQRLGTKVRPGEHFLDAVDRIMSGPLKPLASHISLMGSRIETDTGLSKKLGVSTTYNRIVHVSRLHSDVPLDIVTVKADQTVQQHISDLGFDRNPFTTDLDELLNSEICLLYGGTGKILLCGWLLPETFERLRGNSRPLHNFITGLPLDEAVAAKVREVHNSAEEPAPLNDLVKGESSVYTHEMKRVVSMTDVLLHLPSCDPPASI